MDVSTTAIKKKNVHENPIQAFYEADSKSSRDFFSALHFHYYSPSSSTEWAQISRKKWPMNGSQNKLLLFSFERNRFYLISGAYRLQFAYYCCCRPLHRYPLFLHGSKKLKGKKISKKMWIFDQKTKKAAKHSIYPKEGRHQNNKILVFSRSKWDIEIWALKRNGRLWVFALAHLAHSNIHRWNTIA